VLTEPRLRQVALAARDCDAVSAELQREFGWGDPFHDPGVRQFGLVNSVFAAGDTFVEVVAPVDADTTAGRYLERRGGDSGYMAIFQMPDLATTRRRVEEVGVRVVWTADLPDIAGTHLHPKDTPGAIVSLDWAYPPGSWRWAGPAWTGHAAAEPAGASITGLTVEVHDPAAAAERWAAVLGLGADPAADGSFTVALPAAGQTLRFVPARSDGRGEGITEIAIGGDGDGHALIAGVRFITTRATGAAREATR
jgi:hypothetical protein